MIHIFRCWKQVKLVLLLINWWFYLCGCASGKVPDATDSEASIAYFARNDPAIYVAKGYEKLVAQETGARLDGNIWMLPEEDFGVKRPMKTIDPLQPRVAILWWVYIGGYDCVEKEKGQWVDVIRRDGQFLYSFQTRKKRKWCLTVLETADTNPREYACKAVKHKFTRNVSFVRGGPTPTNPGRRVRKKIITYVCID